MSILAQQVMPDHVHFVLRIHRDLRSVRFGHLIRGLKTGINQARRSTVSPPLRGGFVDYSPSSREASRGSGLLQQGFGMRTILSEESLATVVRYVHDNPRRAWLKRHHPDLFRIRRHLSLSVSPPRCGGSSVLSFSALGNMFLLDYPVSQVIACSRQLADSDLQNQLAAALEAARHGAVTYTAAISDGERRIARAIREAGFPLVVLLADGFPKEGSPHEPYYKPGGAYFDACAAGRLLLLEPAESAFSLPVVMSATESTLREKALLAHREYSPLPIDSPRYRFVAQNEILRLLTSRPILP